MKKVDDFCVSCKNRDTAKSVITTINDKMTIDVKELGLISRFNGVDVTQTRHYIKLSNAVYMEKILRNHPWILKEHPPALFPSPMRSDKTYVRSLETATPFTDKERQQYESKLGFTYCQGIGEVIYALVNAGQISCLPPLS